MADRPLILLSNDDGVEASGLLGLRHALAAIGEVVIVAPTVEQSANSHAITLDRPLRHSRLEPGVHAVDGTPADCVYVALYHSAILPRRPDLVVSGVNRGPNLGSDIFYSGTVAAAREGALRGVPAIAFSMMHGGHMDGALAFAAHFVRRFVATGPFREPAPLINVNFPKGEPRGARVTKLGRRLYSEEVTVRHDPRGREYIWIGGSGSVTHEPVGGSDTEAVDAGYISVTPLLLDVTALDYFALVQNAIADKERGR